MTSSLRTSKRPAPAFIEQLRDARLAAGLTQIELTARLGWGSVDRLRASEDAIRAVHPRLAADWAAALGLQIVTVPLELPTETPDAPT